MKNDVEGKIAMKVFEFSLVLRSDFATELQGDTLFGHICWQLAQDPGLAGDISALLQNYDKEPFCVVSDPVMFFEKNGSREYLFKAPFLPQSSKDIVADPAGQMRQENDRKRRKRLKWTITSTSLKLDHTREETMAGVAEIKSRYALPPEWEGMKTVRQTHNSIDRLTGTTGTGAAFAPYAVNQYSWHPETRFAVFVGVRGDIKIAAVKKALSRIGITGYGADASTGKGRFEITEQSEVDLANFGNAQPDAICVISAVVPEAETYSAVYFDPFVKFGKHGNVLATGASPFKQPVLKAAAGAVLMPLKDKWPQKPYIGRAIRGLSRHSETVEQGYALYIPIKAGVKND